MPTSHPPQLDATEFSARLKEAMEDRGISTKRGAGKWLANRFGTSGVTASAWLKGEHRADTERSRRMASDLGVEFEWLYFGKLPKRRSQGTAEQQAAYDVSALSEFEIEVVDLLRRSPSNFKELARQLLIAAPKIGECEDGQQCKGSPAGCDPSPRHDDDHL